MDRQKFAARLRFYRLAKGLSRPQLAELSNVPNRSLESWEQGRREPGAFDLARVADVLGVTVEQLVSDDAPDPPDAPAPTVGRPPKSPPAPPRPGPGRRRGPKE